MLQGVPPLSRSAELRGELRQGEREWSDADAPGGGVYDRKVLSGILPGGPMSTPVSGTAALDHAADLADFVAASPSSYHAAAEVARR